MFTPQSVSDTEIEAWFRSLFTIPEAMHVHYEFRFLVAKNIYCKLLYIYAPVWGMQNNTMGYYKICFGDRGSNDYQEAVYQYIDKAIMKFIYYIRTLSSLDRSFVRMLWQHNPASQTQN